VLPYIEQGNIYKTQFGSTSYAGTGGSSYTPWGTPGKVNTYTCPSAQSGGSGGFTAYGGGWDGWNNWGTSETLQTSSAQILSPKPEWLKNSAMCNQIADGTANTIMMGESLGSGANTGSWTWTGGASDAWNASSTFYQYGSRHSGVSQFMFGDGSVRNIAAGVSPTTWSASGSRGDGEVLGQNW
jgi:prepilin-type processing-associated H-X9-DG protein